MKVAMLKLPDGTVVENFDGSSEEMLALIAAKQGQQQQQQDKPPSRSSLSETVDTVTMSLVAPPPAPASATPPVAPVLSNFEPLPHPPRALTIKQKRTRSYITSDVLLKVLHEKVAAKPGVELDEIREYLGKAPSWIYAALEFLSHVDDLEAVKTAQGWRLYPASGVQPKAAEEETEPPTEPDDRPVPDSPQPPPNEPVQLQPPAAPPSPIAVVSSPLQVFRPLLPPPPPSSSILDVNTNPNPPVSNRIEQVQVLAPTPPAPLLKSDAKPYYQATPFPKKRVALAGHEFDIWKDGVVWKVYDLTLKRQRDVGRDYDVSTDLEALKRAPVTERALIESEKLRPTLYSVLIGLAKGCFDKRYLLAESLEESAKDRAINLDASIPPRRLLDFLRREGLLIRSATRGDQMQAMNPYDPTKTAFITFKFGDLSPGALREILVRLGFEIEPGKAINLPRPVRPQVRNPHR